MGLRERLALRASPQRRRRRYVCSHRLRVQQVRLAYIAHGTTGAQHIVITWACKRAYKRTFLHTNSARGIKQQAKQKYSTDPLLFIAMVRPLWCIVSSKGPPCLKKGLQAGGSRSP